MPNEDEDEAMCCLYSRSFLVKAKRRQQRLYDPTHAHISFSDEPTTTCSSVDSTATAGRSVLPFVLLSSHFEAAADAAGIFNRPSGTNINQEGKLKKNTTPHHKVVSVLFIGILVTYNQKDKEEEE